MPKGSLQYFDYEGNLIPLKVYIEWRNNVRIAVGKDAFLLRIPKFLPKIMHSVEIVKAEKWARKTLYENEEIRNRYLSDSYSDGDSFIAGQKLFRINLIIEKRKTSTARIIEDEIIQIKLSDELFGMDRANTIRTLVSRMVGQYFLEDIKSRVDHYNNLYFQEDIRKVSLKYNKTNWGSCSAKSNINLSTRLLLTPEAVMDYVIIHELAHLKELNHSSKFWNWVSKADPEYQEKEKWLNKNGHLCDFK